MASASPQHNNTGRLAAVKRMLAARSIQSWHTTHPAAQSQSPASSTPSAQSSPCTTTYCCTPSQDFIPLRHLVRRSKTFQTTDILKDVVVAQPINLPPLYSGVPAALECRTVPHPLLLYCLYPPPTYSGYLSI